MHDNFLAAIAALKVVMSVSNSIGQLVGLLPRLSNNDKLFMSY